MIKKRRWARTSAQFTGIASCFERQKIFFFWYFTLHCWQLTESYSRDFRGWVRGPKIKRQLSFAFTFNLFLFEKMAKWLKRYISEVVL